jgi:Ras-related protein Rab-2A
MSKLLYDYIFKFIIVGNSAVGKSNILSKFSDKRFHNNHEITICMEFVTKLVCRNDIVYKLQIWDTAGQEAFKSITRSFYRGSIGCLLVYDVTDRKSFEALETWINDVRRFEPSIIIVLIGNKIDLAQNREISTEEGKAFADKHYIGFLETSAKSAENINESFNHVIDKINNKIVDKTLNVASFAGCVQVSKLSDTPAPTSGCYCQI